MKESLEELLTKSLRKQVLVDHIKDNHQDFEKAITISLTDDQPRAWRAAWLLFHCMKNNDQRISPHLNKAIKLLNNFNDGHQREWLKILNKMKLSDDQHSLLFDTCISIWEDINKSPSVRGTAFQTLLKIIKNYPDSAYCQKAEAELQIDIKALIISSKTYDCKIEY